MTLQDQISKLGATIKQHAPELLTIASVAGVVATAYLSGRAGYIAGGTIVAEMSRRMDEVEDADEIILITPKEIVQKTWKLYIPATVVAVCTAGAVIGSNRVSNQRNVALIASAALGERAFQEYRDKVVETTSKSKEQKVQDSVIDDQVKEKSEEFDKLIPKMKDGNVLCIESYTGRTFLSTAEKIHKAANDTVREYQTGHSYYATANEFWTRLGLPHVDAGDVVGWSSTIPLEVQIGGSAHNLDDGSVQPVLTVGYSKPPSVTFATPF